MVNPKKRQTDATDGSDKEVTHHNNRVEEDNVTSAECNSLVATFISDYRDETPQIGSVLNVEGASVTIEWL